MPIFKIINTTFSNDIYAKIMVWKISESIAELSANTFLTSKSKLRIASMKSEIHQKGFLCIRKMLLECAIFDKDLRYDKTGKPFLKNGMHISITHSHNFAAIIVSTYNAGIDIEQMQEKIKGIAKKFCLSEFDFLKKDEEQYIQNLTAIWGAKESVFKIENKKGISFKDHIDVQSFNSNDNKISVLLNFDNHKNAFEMRTMTIENYVMVYGVKL